MVLICDFVKIVIVATDCDHITYLSTVTSAEFR